MVQTSGNQMVPNPDCRVDGEPPPIQYFQLVTEFSWQYAALRCLDEKAHLSMSDLFLNKHHVWLYSRSHSNSYYSLWYPFPKNQQLCDLSCPRKQSSLCCCFSGVFTSEGLPCLGSSMMLVLPPLNLSIHLYTFLWFKQLLPYWADILVKTSLGFTPSAARNLITALVASYKGAAI